MLAAQVAAPLATPDVTLEPVGAAQWDRFAALVERDHLEGKRTGDHDEAVAAGLLDGMRARMGPCRYWLLGADGVDAGYGMTARCPNGLGLIENLFTLPDRRGRGLMSAFIVAAADRLRAEGCDAVFLDAHVHDTPHAALRAAGLRARRGDAGLGATGGRLTPAPPVPSRDGAESAAES